MKITATDADEPGLENSQIAYSIIAQDPSDDMFYMTDDGTIYVNRPFLDREVQYFYFNIHFYIRWCVTLTLTK